MRGRDAGSRSVGEGRANARTVGEGGGGGGGAPHPLTRLTYAPQPGHRVASFFIVSTATRVSGQHV